MQINYHCAERTVKVEEDDPTILEVSTASKIPHLRECGGNGRCTTCRVRILTGVENLSPRTAAEVAVAEARGWDDFTRLACQTRLTGDVGLMRLLKTSAEVCQLQIETLPEGTGTTRKLAILFCDMRNFTPFVESNLAFDVVHILNRLFSVLGDSILINSGLIYQYVGDEITGLFGLGDEAAEKSCLSAVRAALDMLDSLDQLNKDLSADFKTELSVGIGVHFGEVIVGKIGHESDRRFAVVGDSVNVASRIQGANKELRTQLLVSEQLLEQLSEDTLRTGKTSSVTLKGKSAPFRVSQVLGFNAPDPLQIVQSTWKVIADQNRRFGDGFYERLFTAAPELRGLFSGDVSLQAQMLTQMLETVIYATSRPQHLALGLASLGRRHSGYGVKSEHYETVRDCLLDTIRDTLGDNRHTDEVAGAWTSTIDSVIQMMQMGDQRNRNF